jgi:hypothetical protein
VVFHGYSIADWGPPPHHPAGPEAGVFKSGVGEEEADIDPFEQNVINLV